MEIIRLAVNRYHFKQLIIWHTPTTELGGVTDNFIILCITVTPYAHHRPAARGLCLVSCSLNYREIFHNIFIRARFVAGHGNIDCHSMALNREHDDH